MRLQKIIFALVLFLVFAMPLWAYSPPTHEEMSERAAILSELQKFNSCTLLRLGLKPNLRNTGQKFPNSGGKEKTILQLIRNGAYFFVNPNTPEENRRNHFTVFDAREAMYRALTGRHHHHLILQGAAA